MKVRHVLLALIVCAIGVGGASGAECPIDCPGDLNGDCKVDFRDFAILSGNWLKDCTLPPALPVLMVRQAGMSDDQAEKLARNLNIPPQMLAFEDGMVGYVDPENLQKIPTMPLNDAELMAELQKESELEEGSELLFEVLDMEGLRKIEPLSIPEVEDEVLVGFSQAGVELGEMTSEPSHTVFEVVDLGGQLLLPAVQMDTHVNVQMYSGGIPIVGPGAQLSASLGPDGRTTHLHAAIRTVERGDPVEIMMPGEAAQRAFAASGNRFIPEGDMKMVYYAPPLSEKNVQMLIPHYDLGGILYGPQGQQSNKLRKLVPATNDPRVVPQVSLLADARGNLVEAQANVSGGAKPYRFEWFSSSVDLTEIPNDQDQIEYNAMPREQSGPETVTVKVTDDNGVIVEASATVQIQFFALQNVQGEAIILVGGVRDFGVERAVSDLCAANQSGFINRFLADGVVKRFNWTGSTAWENDFKQPPAGADTTWVDNADIVFYCGHGYGGGFTFESNNDDGYLTYTDAAGAWGNNDLEWLSLLSCQVLKDTYDSKKWYTRWGPAFDGLHLLTGFQTNAYDWPDFGGRYASYMLGRNFGFVTVKLPVRAAWFKAKKEEQPSSVQAVVMGVVGPGGVLGGYNDYFWGKGPVSPDLRGGNIRGYWRIVYQ